MQKLIFTNGGGKKIDLTSGAFGITNWEGLSGTELNIQTQQVPFQDGAVFLDALMEQREISVTVAIQDDSDLELRYNLKRQLISALNPKLGEGVLIYKNNFLERQIKAVPQLPIFENKNSNDPGTLKATVTFSCPSPYWEDLEEKEVEFKFGELPIIENDGDIPAQMKIEFLADNVVNPEIVKMNGGDKIKFSGTLNKNLYINTNVGKKQVYNEDLKFNIGNYKGRFFTIDYSHRLGMFVATCDIGSMILYSYDAKKWYYIMLEERVSFKKVKYISEKNIFMVISSNGKIATSSDGITWSVKDTGFLYDFNDVYYSNELELFIIAGSNGTIITSPDGITWTKRSGEYVARDLTKIIYSSDLNLFVVLCTGDGYPFVYTSSDGITWNPRSISGSTTLRDICYSSELNLFVVVGLDGKIATSPDGITWTQQTSGVNIQLNSIVYSSELELFAIACGSNNDGKILTSPDGITWTSSYEPSQEVYLKIGYSNEFHYFVCTMQGKIIISFDGVNWGEKSFDGVGVQDNIEYIEDLGLTIILMTGTILTSSDGITWTSSYVNMVGSPVKVIYWDKIKKFVAVGSAGTILTSSDGITWTQQTSGVNTGLGSIFSSLDKLIAVGGAGTILTSSDGITWTQQTSGVNDDLADGCYSNDLGLYVISSRGSYYSKPYILTSPDGITWIKQSINVGSPSSLGNSLLGVVYSKKINSFVVIGSNSDNEGYSVTSSDGITWDIHNFNLSSGSNYITDFCYSEQLNLFIAVLRQIGHSEILISKNGIDWEKINFNNEYFLCIEYSSELNKFYIPTKLGFLTSSDGITWVEETIRGSYITLSGICYSNRLHKFVMLNANVIFYSSLNEAENQIQNITFDSNMNMNLSLGENEFRLARDSGSLMARIKYRQKYIGV